MLVLSRKQTECIIVGGAGGSQMLVKVTVIAITNGVVKLGFDAAPDVPIHRFEVFERIKIGMAAKSA